MEVSSVIVAVASPPGRAWRGIVRLSGERTHELLSPVIPLPPGAGLRAARLRLERLEIPCLALCFSAPRSYTGEDAAELQLPGNPGLLERVVDGLIGSARARGIDARRAGPGEFTARAYMRGRLTLTESEGVAATIAATSDAELRAAAHLRTGRLGRLADELSESLAATLALVEAGIDFTDSEDVVAISPADLDRRVLGLAAAIDDQLERAVGMETLSAIPWVVLAGPPNAGKSTLFNRLLGRSRAVVSDVAGTTRDVLAEPLEIETPHGAAEIMLADVAGSDPRGVSTLDRAMQRAARDALERADLIILCESGESGESGDAPDGARTMRVDVRADPDVAALRRAIATRLAGRAVSLAADAVALRPRHEAALRAARERLEETRDLVDPAADALSDPELVAASLRAALDELAALAGEITPDDVLGRIFATFCIGK